MTAVAHVYVDHAFLDPAACRRIRAAMDRGASDPAEVLGGLVSLDRAVRRVTSVDVDAETLAEVEGRLEQQRDAIAAFHRCVLGDREGVSFLRYRGGDFYKAHRDRAVVAAWPDAARRRVAVVVFLNGATGASPAEFTGGTLRLLEGVQGPVDILPQQGALVAFDAALLHEVAPVVTGTRDTLVDWFYDVRTTARSPSCSRA